MKISRRSFYTTFFFCFFIPTLCAQHLSRSGQTAENHNLRLFPCGGDVIFEEGFNGNDIPPGWTVLDLDSLTPRAEIAAPPVSASPGWQSHVDFMEFRNRLVISPSWYTDSTKASDDWLISPLITLGSNTCLSWKAYSQDPFFTESYEVRISTGTPTVDSAGFLALPPLLAIAEEDNESVYRSVNLAAYANRDVYIAFRQTSKDKFVLAIDDVRLANVLTQDIAAFAIEQPDNPQPTDILEVKGSIRNLGSDTLRADSLLKVHFTVDGANPQEMTIADTVVLAPNDTLEFVHDSTWSPNADRVYRLCVWTSGVPDMNTVNDTSCIWVGVGRLVGLEEELKSQQIKVYPNPVQDQLFLRLNDTQAAAELHIRLVDLHGRELLRTAYLPAGNKDLNLNLGDVPTGVYILQLNSRKRLLGRVRIVKK